MTKASIDISQITSKLLKEKVYLASFPEYYALSSVTENGLWHRHQNVLDHVIGVFAGLETILEFKDLDLEQKNKLKEYLSKVVGNQSRQNILKVATLLHDIAKIDVVVERPDGTVGCPGHELIGAGRVKNFAERFNLDSAAESYVERLVRYHGYISEILNSMIAKKDKEKYFLIFKETVGDVAVELTLLIHADLLGSDLAKNDKNGYDERVAHSLWMLKALLEEME